MFTPDYYIIIVVEITLYDICGKYVSLFDIISFFTLVYCFIFHSYTVTFAISL